MINLFYNIGQVLGVTIIHSLWQGLLIYFVLRLIFSSVPGLSSGKKYNFSTIGLAVMAVWFIYTFCVQAYAYDWNPSPVIYTASNVDLLTIKLQAIAARPDFKTTFYNSIKVYLPYVSVIYVIGLIVNLGRLILAWKNIRIIKKSIIKAENMQDRINEFCRQLKIRRRVQVAFSRLVEVPCVIGYLKPLLLLPITLTFQLSPEEIETVILHELSHIKRNDYLVNTIQQIISVLLFFNPFAQLISNIISTERENRCDDMVVEKTESPLTYAYALLKLEEVRSTEVRLALAATQNKHHLLNRIERIMKTKTPIGNIRPIIVALLLITGSLSVAWLNPEVKNGKVTFKKIAAIHAAAAVEPAAEIKTEPVKHQHKHIIIAYSDTTKARLNDTTKKKIKIVVQDENGNTKEYNSVNDMPEADRKDFYKETFNNDIKFNFDMKMDSNLARINKFYSSDKWKKQMADVQQQLIAMGKKFNSEAFKKQAEMMKLNSEAMQKKAKEFGDKMQKQFNSPEFKKKMEDFQKKMNSPEFKKKMEDLEKEGGADAYFNSPQWKSQVDAIAKQGDEIGKMYDSPDFKKQIDAIAQQGADMAKVYDSPEFKNRMESMAKVYDSPEFKKQMEDLAKQAGEIAKHANDFNFNFDYNNSNDERPEKKEKVEKKEKAESKGKVKSADTKKKSTVERAEKKEKVEKPEAPENPEN
jgi:beta-lactamase regulating signal transducer with metallopeptidase domain